jgi:hypothetical protein
MAIIPRVGSRVLVLEQPRRRDRTESSTSLPEKSSPGSVDFTKGQTFQESCQWILSSESTLSKIWPTIHKFPRRGQSA